MKAKNWTPLIAALILGYQSTASANPSPFPLPSQVIEVKREKTALPPLNVIPGPPIKPSAQLLDWLNQQAEATSGLQKQVRLPVFISFKDSSRFTINDSFIGTSDADRDRNTIFLSLNDYRMGIPLTERLKAICPKPATSCVVWLEGYWEKNFLFGRSDLREKKENQWPFGVVRVYGLVTEQAQPNQEIKVFIESRSP